MKLTYYTNHAVTSKSLTEWYFGKKFVEAAINNLKKLNNSRGQREIKVWQSGTGYLTVKIN